MKQELKQKYVEALRSGDYSQTRGWLHNKSGFCCLGVLADITGLAIDPNGREIVDESGNLVGYDPLQELIGSGVSCNDLWRLNDIHGKSFAEIADWVEDNIPVTE